MKKSLTREGGPIRGSQVVVVLLLLIVIVRGILTQTSKPQRIKSDRAVVLRLQTNKTLEQRIPVDFTLSN